ncbi:hypothetical protein C1645_776375 [Glomus cerebriforme]|uniref:Uncharacterized protein n=1 Tax=Glomus cerebriforme TaxID=658196 RepID=A0A397SNZ5_9GLOM|nr:hypothetical protein C1645_776375 [Glomus cerebriforme]
MTNQILTLANAFWMIVVVQLTNSLVFVQIIINVHFLQERCLTTQYVYFIESCCKEESAEYLKEFTFVTCNMFDYIRDTVY